MRASLFTVIGILLGASAGWFLFPALLYRSSEQPLHFSHRTHTGESGGMSCTDCHTLNETGRFQGIPATAKCAECHAAPLGTSVSEQRLVDEFITPNKEIPWKIYSRQPDNAHFPHAQHTTLAEIACAECHGPHGTSDTLRLHQTNRISGYSRDIWGANIAGFGGEPWEGMKMDRCVRCHATNNRRDGCVACHK